MVVASKAALPVDAAQRFSDLAADVRFNLPDPPRKFPAQEELFPAPMRREFAEKWLLSQRLSSIGNAPKGQILQKFPDNSLLIRESGLESGSQQTACTASLHTQPD